MRLCLLFAYATVPKSLPRFQQNPVLKQLYCEFDTYMPIIYRAPCGVKLLHTPFSQILRDVQHH